MHLDTGVQDDTVPHTQARQLAVDRCHRGGNVTYKTSKLPNPGDEILTDHVVPRITDLGDALSLHAEHLSGKPVTSNCGTTPGQPCPPTKEVHRGGCNRPRWSGHFAHRRHVRPQGRPVPRQCRSRPRSTASAMAFMPASSGCM
ncbi:hypothetical protein ACIHCV_22785 [Streptomyces sp. NPDC051956]|uniref:hypothetical protein n=1 Tax=Streptomyces sp. NPDC051956 TaxID=3365677 RepID=UPI0037D40F00